jgi:protein-disulfide isomerase
LGTRAATALRAAPRRSLGLSGLRGRSRWVMLPAMHMRAGWRQVALMAAITGAGISAYLLVEYTNGQGGICLTGGGCDVVRASAFAYPLGIPMPLIGVAFYVVAAWTAWRTVNPAPLLGVAPRTVLVLQGAIGIAVSAFLTGIEAFVIHAFCTWCLAQAAASLVLGVAAFVGLRSGPDADAVDPSASRRTQRRLAGQRAAEQRSLARTGAVATGTMAILVAGLLAGGALMRGNPVSSASAGADLAPASAPRIGYGPVTVVEFADFQCPGCAGVAPPLQQLVDEGSITLVYRYFPLSQHHFAQLTSRAAAAAALQGKFWPFHDRLFATQTAWENLSDDHALAYITQLATEAGLDVAGWDRDRQSAAVADEVSSDAAAALALNLPGTPAILINGSPYQGSLTLDGLRAAVTAARG